MTAEGLESQLEAIGDRLREADAQRALAMGQLMALVPRAREAGVPITRIAELGGVTRPTVYKMLRD